MHPWRKKELKWDAMERVPTSVWARLSRCEIRNAGESALEVLRRFVLKTIDIAKSGFQRFTFHSFQNLPTSDTIG